MCVIFAHHLLLDYALICVHFGRFLDEFEYGVCVYKSFERVNLWYRCVYCDQSSDWWRVIEWESPCGRVWVHQCDESEEWDGDGADVRRCLWVTAVLSCEVLARLTTELLRVCVSLCRRLLQSAISYNKKLCCVCIWLCSVIDSSPSMVCWLYCVKWSFPSSRWTVYLLRRAQYFGVRSVKPYRISQYLFACTYAV